MESEKKYMLEVRILDHGNNFAQFEATDLATGKVYKQNLPTWIFGYTRDYITEHTRFVLLCPKPEGHFSIGWMTDIFGRSWDPNVLYHQSSAEVQRQWDLDHAGDY
jgi:hypothetical protein